MATISTAQAKAILANLGFRVNTASRYAQALRDFQNSWSLGTWLKVDGILGPMTSAALLASEARRRKGLSTLSAHFSYREFVCRCGGAYAACRRVWVDRRLIAAAEKYRGLNGPTTVVSGCRCPGHNKAVGGATYSQHQYGLALDVRAQQTPSRIKGLRAFSAIGIQRSTGKALHIDVRHLGPHNNGGTIAAPIVYYYAS